jgi:hypothetical protein
LSVRASIYVYAPHPGCGTLLSRPGQAPWAQAPLQETGPEGRCLLVKAVSLKHMHERSSRPTSTCGRRGVGAEGGGVCSTLHETLRSLCVSIYHCTCGPRRTCLLSHDLTRLDGVLATCVVRGREESRFEASDRRCGGAAPRPGNPGHCITSPLASNGWRRRRRRRRHMPGGSGSLRPYSPKPV